MAGTGYQETEKDLSAKVKDMHRAIVSLMEEIEAVDVYNQRADVCSDSELKEILLHNGAEEKEHAAMLLEWIRRQDPGFDKQLKRFLFSDKAIED